MGGAIKLADHNSLKVYLKLHLEASKEVNPLASLIMPGNVKIPKTTAIFNMGSATDCPSYKLGLCQAVLNGKRVCYAIKSEKSYRPFTLPFRRKQEKYWKASSAEKFATDFIALNLFKPVPFNALRFNEAGDFWSQECLDKAETIARILRRYGVRTYCYTARRDLDFSHCNYLVVSGSGFKKEGIKGIFLMVRNAKKDRPRGFGICKGSCAGCGRCLIGRQTVIQKH
jgi:hypothetical protein